MEQMIVEERRLNPVSRTLFSLKMALSRYRAWYKRQIAIRRHAAEEEVRSLNGTVTWRD